MNQADCVFCKIVKGELPCFKVYEDANFLAFLDKFPRAPGHCLLVPKQHYRWVWDLPHIGPFMEAAQRIANAQREAFGTEMIISHIIGDEVPHAHLWLVPHGHTQNDQLEGEAMAQVIRQHLSF